MARTEDMDDVADRLPKRFTAVEAKDKIWVPRFQGIYKKPAARARSRSGPFCVRWMTTTACFLHGENRDARVAGGRPSQQRSLGRCVTAAQSEQGRARDTLISHTHTHTTHIRAAGECGGSVRLPSSPGEVRKLGLSQSH